AERLGDVVVPALPDDADPLGLRLEQVAERVAGVELALDPPRHPERDKAARLHRQLTGGSAEDLVVLGVGTGPSGFDEGDAEPVELLGEPELVVDGERDPFQLRAVAQGRVIDLYFARRRVTGHVRASLCSGRLRRGRCRRTAPGSRA